MDETRGLADPKSFYVFDPDILTIAPPTPKSALKMNGDEFVIEQEKARPNWLWQYLFFGFVWEDVQGEVPK